MLRKKPLRLGIVPYLNVMPLLEGLDKTFPASNWVRATPRELAGLLASGEVDVATLPIFEALRAGTYQLVPKCAIASIGPVRSVALYATCPLNRIKRVLLDRSSLTSVHLARIVCKEYLGLEPEYEFSSGPLRANDDPFAGGHDAVAVIGDTALAWRGRFPHVLDLGSAWNQMTNLPFVYAAWVARPDAELTEEELRAFHQARREGCRLSYEIARRVAGDDPAQLLDIVEYLTRAIHYKLGHEEMRGIDAFRRRLIEHGFLPRTTSCLELLAPPEATSAA